MTRFISSELPPDLLARFRPNSLSKYANNVVVIVTVGEDGFAHPAMLSHFEIVARDAQSLRLATYSDSRTTGNLRRGGRLTLIVVDEGIAYYVKGVATEIRSQMTTAPHNALHNLRVEAVLADHADVEREGDVVITQGITYDDPNMSAKLARASETFAEMLT